MFLKYADMWDMPIDGASDEKKIPHWFGNLAWVVIGGVFKLLFRYRVDGRENLRAFKGVSGVLLVANHTSFLDVVFMYLACRPSQWVRFMGRDTLFDNAGGLIGQGLSRVGAFPVKRDSADRTSIKRAARMLKVRFMGRDTLFDNAGGLIGQGLSRVGAFPVKRDSADRTSIKRAARMLKGKEVVGILPEGTRRGKGTKTPEIHAGAAFVARMGHAPIIPMTVRNAELVKQKGKMIRFPKITVEFGEPLLVGDFDFLPKEDRLEGCTWYAMRECFALSRRVPASEVDMRELFPQGRDFTEEFAAHAVPRHRPDELVAQIEAERKDA